MHALHLCDIPQMSNVFLEKHSVNIYNLILCLQCSICIPHGCSGKSTFQWSYIWGNWKRNVYKHLGRKRIGLRKSACCSLYLIGPPRGCLSFGFHWDSMRNRGRKKILKFFASISTWIFSQCLKLYIFLFL